MDKRSDHEWHVSINRYEPLKGFVEKSFMYEAKRAWQEHSRLPRLFEMERLGTLPKIHRQCSMSAPVEVKDNHLTCCLGVKCKECPALLALEKTKAPPNDIDEMKSWTCVGHILQQCSEEFTVDTSEGYILTEDDKMFWQNVYRSLDSVE